MSNGIIGIYIPRGGNGGVIKAINVYTKKNVVGQTVFIGGNYLSIHRILRSIKLAPTVGLIPYKISVDNTDIFFYYSREFLGFFRELNIEEILKEVKESLGIHIISNDIHKFYLDEFAEKLLVSIAQRLENIVDYHCEREYAELFKKI